MSTQSTQYNSIQRPYDEVMKQTVVITSRVNVREMLLPIIKGASVLDLACGSGFHTRKFLEMGAGNVVGVDISAGMLAAARETLADEGDRVSFIEADGSVPTQYPGGPFDIVFGGWFLNYAPNKDTMINFYRTILKNLKPGGLFVGVTPVPTDNPEALYEKERSLRPLEMRSGLFTTMNHPVKDGFSVHRHIPTAAGNVDFDTFHLRQDIWESAAREAGFSEQPQWCKQTWPADFMVNPTAYGEPHNGGASPEEMATYAELGHYAILKIQN